MNGKQNRMRTIGERSNERSEGRSEPTINPSLQAASNHHDKISLIKLGAGCGDPSCTLCIEDIAVEPLDLVERRQIIAEIRDLQAYGNEHPESRTEIFWRTNALLDQLGDDS
jgi:hypothetical protein